MSVILKKSPVEFDEQLHRYSLGEKRLMGITGLIHSVLELGVYADANEFVKNTAIPRAAEYGSAVHKSIEVYDDLGIRQTTYPNSFGDNDWDVSRELDSYIKHRNGFTPIANEYTVSDELQYASQIDNVWLRESTGGIWLADTKTNNLNYYPLNGYGKMRCFANHEDGLKEYLSWQLSIYAYLFEKQNHELKVEGLCANWLRKDNAAFWIIERKSDEAVKELLKAVWYEDLDGQTVYEHPDRTKLHPLLENPSSDDEESIITDEMVAYMAKLLRDKQHIEDELNRVKPLLKEAMENRNMNKWDGGPFKATIGADSERKTFDTKRFEKEHPELATQYFIKKPVKGSFTIKLKEEAND